MENENHPEEEGVEELSLGGFFRESSLAKPREIGLLARVGYKLALLILAYLSIVTAFLLVDYFVHAPSPPAGPTLDQTQLQLYQQLSQTALDRTLKLLDALVLKGFLPVFTAVLGYIFGTRERA